MTLRGCRQTTNVLDYGGILCYNEINKKHNRKEDSTMADEKFDPTKMPPFDPSKMPAFDPSKMPKDFDPSKMPPMPKMEEPETNTTETENLLKQEDPARWLRQPPKKMRGDMRMAMAYGREAEKYKCTCWNKGCPFYGNCRKCIVFHMALKQIPTCQRDMIVEMLKDGTLVEEMYVNDPVPPKK